MLYALSILWSFWMEVMCLNCKRFFFVDERLDIDGKDVNDITCSLECAMELVAKGEEEEKLDEG